MSVYLDAGAATPMSSAARDAFMAAAELFGDPLSIHSSGRKSRQLLDSSRESIAAAIGAQPDEIVFTSGGTESVAMGIWGSVRAVRELGDRVVVGALEHPAVGGATNVLESEGFETAIVGCGPDGRIDLDQWAAEVRRPGTLLASLHHANHELGTMQQIGEAARLARAAGVRFHTDACQTVGQLPVDVKALEVDLLSFSGHKFGGPPGVGALFVRRGVAVAAHPCGDDRERKRRAGMENLQGIAAMAAALTASVQEMAESAGTRWTLTGRLRERLAEVPGVTVHGHPTHRVPHLMSFSVEGVDPATLMMSLDDKGFQVGAGSTCTGQPSDPSPVLEALGVTEPRGFRIGLTADVTESEIDELLVTLPELISQLRSVQESSSRAMTEHYRRENPAP